MNRFAKGDEKTIDRLTQISVLDSTHCHLGLFAINVIGCQPAIPVVVQVSYATAAPGVAEIYASFLRDSIDLRFDSRDEVADHAVRVLLPQRSTSSGVGVGIRLNGELNPPFCWLASSQSTGSSEPQDDPNVFHVYLGYAGWSRNQLQKEVALGSWFIFPADTNVVFSSAPDSLWPQMIQKTELKFVDNRPRYYQGLSRCLWSSRSISQESSPRLPPPKSLELETK